MLVSRARQTSFVILQLFSDLLFVAGGLLFAYWLRLLSGLIPTAGAWEGIWYLREFPQAVVIWIACLYATGNYVNHPRVITFNRARRVLMAGGLAMVLIVAKNYFLRVPDLSRLMYPISFLSVTAAVLTGRGILQRLIVVWLRRRSIPRSRVIIAGMGPLALRIAARLRRHPEYAYELVGFLSPDGSHRTGRRIGGFPVLGEISDLRAVLRDHDIQDVFIAQGIVSHEDMLQLFLESEAETARVHIIPTLSEMMRTKIYYDELIGVPLYRIRETPLHGANFILKRVFDVVLASLGLLFISPLMLMLAVLVKRMSPGPALYVQKRLGLDGQEFTIYKFRTMPVDAEQHGPVWSDGVDGRASRLGNFMRRWGLDELPQLWNVIRGDMSLVGPRPEREIYVRQFREAIPHYMARHKVLTGMTGWAQVHGLRGSTSIPARLRYDLYYIENWSLWLDIKILLMTFRPLRRRKRRAVPPTPVPAEPRTDVAPKNADHPIPQRTSS